MNKNLKILKIRSQKAETSADIWAKKSFQSQKTWVLNTKHLNLAVDSKPSINMTMENRKKKKKPEEENYNKRAKELNILQLVKLKAENKSRSL